MTLFLEFIRDLRLKAAAKLKSKEKQAPPGRQTQVLEVLAYLLWTLDILQAGQKNPTRCWEPNVSPK